MGTTEDDLQAMFSTWIDMLNSLVVAGAIVNLTSTILQIYYQDNLSFKTSLYSTYITIMIMYLIYVFLISADDIFCSAY